MQVQIQVVIFSSIGNKVHVRKLVCDKTPDEAFVNELIYSLGDGWNKINEFSVHPSIFKFLKERLEMYKVKEQLDEISPKDSGNEYIFGRTDK